MLGVGFLVIALGTLFGGFRVYHEIKRNQALVTQFMHVSDISLMALDLNVANFQTQLELWEYASLEGRETPDEFLEHRALPEEYTKKMSDEVKKNTVF